MAEATLLARRLANFRREESRGPARAEPRDATGFAGVRLNGGSSDLARRLAAALDAEVVETPLGDIVRLESPSRPIPVDRDLLARLPGLPPADVPLICLDTETTGLATAAGTVAFLVGLGWWVGQRFRQVQLLLPDQPQEPALLEMLAGLIHPDAWLVTYNGRGFDWPLLVARYRMARRSAPVHAGHLDLLSWVRRLFRHRMADARLKTAEEELLGIGRVDDVEGWEIPGRYLAFLRGGDPRPLIPVATHNERDVRSLAALLGHLADELGDPDRRRMAPDGDLLGLARSFRNEGRLDEALACLDLGVRRPPARGALPRPPGVWPAAGRPSARLTRDHLAAERARTLRRLGRTGDARAGWLELASGGGPLAAVAWVELAKHLEHVERDFGGALDAVAAAGRLAGSAEAIGRPLALLKTDLARRRARLLRRASAARDSMTRIPAVAAGLPAPLVHAGADG
jgi:hypothetical protein